MFVIENFLESRKQAIQKWEVASQKVSYEADYSSEIDRWEERNPRPKSVRHYLTNALIVLVAGLIVFGLVMMVQNNIESYNSPEAVAARQEAAEKKEEQKKAEAEAVANGEVNNCKKFNTEDYVRVQYGDFAEAEGVIIGGCEENEHYQVKLAEGAQGRVEGDGVGGRVDVSGRTISVDSPDNLVVVEKPDNKEKE